MREVTEITKKTKNPLIIDVGFKKELSSLINKFGIDSEMNQPDWKLANYLSDSLVSLDILNIEGEYLVSLDILNIEGE